MPNKVTGATDFITVAGLKGQEVYEVPDNKEYIDADTDFIWFTADGTPRTVTTAELIEWDLQRTPVKYGNTLPTNIEIIAILRAGITLSATEVNELYTDFQLPIFWSGVFNEYGYTKNNRPLIKQYLFPY
jgi:hypothetical protein